MFVSFFYTLKESGIPISPTSFLRLHKALKLGLVTGLDDFYTTARCILVKSERYFDLYDRVFAHVFHGAELPDFTGIDLDAAAAKYVESLNGGYRSVPTIVWPDGSKLVEPSNDVFQVPSAHGFMPWMSRSKASPSPAAVGLRWK